MNIHEINFYNIFVSKKGISNILSLPKNTLFRNDVNIVQTSYAQISVQYNKIYEPTSYCPSDVLFRRAKF